ncbi:hypothetical protein C0J52_17547 [Blattella germanica]|nr:hypothetical protein C0J52_17547 [Blattella germanica]
MKQPRGIISGGSEAHIASEMALYVQPPGSIYFSRRISLDDLVRLGDEIQLRCDVRDGDVKQLCGKASRPLDAYSCDKQRRHLILQWHWSDVGDTSRWQYSRLKDITLHRRSTDGIEIEDSVVLVGPDGCRNPAMKTVCPWQPVQHSDRPLTSSFTWKAFGFQDKGNEKEDLVVSARVLACVHPSDCLLDTSSCTDETQSTRPRRRDVKDAKTNNETVIWRSDLTFKVTKSSASS